MNRGGGGRGAHLVLKCSCVCVFVCKPEYILYYTQHISTYSAFGAFISIWISLHSPGEYFNCYYILWGSELNRGIEFNCFSFFFFCEVEPHESMLCGLVHSVDLENFSGNITKTKQQILAKDKFQLFMNKFAYRIRKYAFDLNLIWDRQNKLFSCGILSNIYRSLWELKYSSIFTDSI